MNAFYVPGIFTAGRRKTLLIGGILVLFIISGISLWMWQRSTESSIEVENEKRFEGMESNQSPAVAVASPKPEEEDEMTEAEEENLVAAEKKLAEEGPKPAQSRGDNESGRGFSIKSRLVSFGHENANDREIDTIVLHSSHGVNGDPYDVDDVIALWKSYGVAPHYMIARDGTVYQLVADKNIAYHAGDSKMPDGRSGVNNFSIGVEILNTKTDEYTSAQYQATKDLIGYLKDKYGKMEVVGHDDIAPGRKTDPWNFKWSKI